MPENPDNKELQDNQNADLLPAKTPGPTQQDSQRLPLPPPPPPQNNNPQSGSYLPPPPRPINQTAPYPASINQLPAPPSYLPTNQIAPLAGNSAQLNNLLIKPVRAASAYDIARRYKTIRRALVVELGLLATIALWLSVISSGLVALTHGTIGIAILLASALPLLMMLPFALWIDRYEPEPPWLLARSLLWGAGAAIIVAGTFNSLVAFTVGGPFATIIGAPFIEEALKGMAVWWVFRQRSEYLHGIKDAVTYALFVGVGFAVMEDTLYYITAFDHQKGSGLIFTVIVRGLATPFLHPFFTAFTAIGIAKVAAGAKSQTAIKWYLLAVFFHGLWNSGIGIILYPFVYMPIFIWGIVRMKKSRTIEENTLVQGITAEINTGLITNNQFKGIISKTTVFEFIKALLSAKNELHARRHMQAAAWALAAHRAAVIQRCNKGFFPQPIDRSVDDHLRLLMKTRANDWESGNRAS